MMGWNGVGWRGGGAWTYRLEGAARYGEAVGKCRRPIRWAGVGDWDFVGDEEAGDPVGSVVDRMERRGLGVQGGRQTAHSPSGDY